MIKICKECGFPCDTIVTERWQESTEKGSFELVDTVSACCGADWDEGTDEDWEEEMFDESMRKINRYERLFGGIDNAKSDTSN